MTRFGSFDWPCTNVPSYPWCNLFYHQFVHHGEQSVLTSSLSSNAQTAAVGINPICGIPRLNKAAADGSDLGNIANTIIAGISVFLVIGMLTRVGRRKAAVARVEFRVFLAAYAVSLVLQILTLGSYFSQGSTVLAALTAIHAGVVAAMFWFLLANAIVSTQIVEDGTPASVIPLAIFGTAFFVGTLYVSLDTAFNWTSAFVANPPQDMNNIALFILTSVWPGVAAIAYFVVMLYVVFVMLQEIKPMLWFIASFVVFALSQLDVFLLSKTICKGTDGVVDGSFVATLLETASVGLLYAGWLSITEEDWSDDLFYGN
ncbi:chitin synthase III catalytic subunit [Auriculariales sp. MPI-PUGE-AT-0066]|nr:chitin synthase III catalytic subunit [Auriculariales sp. MPI-PUGE-AT-0066]